MNKLILPVLHAFDPKQKFLPPKNGEVRFVKGRYLDIATTKGKDIHSLYFGISKNSNLLTGIFLGDLELTSRVKDIQLTSSKDGNINLCVKYINEQGKLATVKTKIPSITAYKDLIDDLKNFKDRLTAIDTSINNLTNNINILNSSVFIIENSLNIINTSINELISDLDAGKYNYTLRESIGPFEHGYLKTYTLFKGEKEQQDSSNITLMDYVLKKLDYNDQNNTLVATIWPDSCGDDIYQWEHIIDADGNDTPIKKGKLNDEYIKTIELNLDNLETHIINTINTDSIINDRLLFVESQLKWEELFNN